MQFNVSTVNRVAKEIEESGRRMQAIDSPRELLSEIQKIQSSLNSIQSLTQVDQVAGNNVNTAQQAPDQNQS